MLVLKLLYTTWTIVIISKAGEKDSPLCTHQIGLCTNGVAFEGKPRGIPHPRTTFAFQLLLEIPLFGNPSLPISSEIQCDWLSHCILRQIQPYPQINK